MKLKHYWKTLIIAAIILTGSILSGKQLNKIPLFEIKYSDKLIHFSMYFVLALSMLSSYYKSFGELIVSKKRIIVLIGIIYGLSLEGVQFYFTSDRSAEVSDMVANSIGCILAFFSYPLLLKFRLYKLL